jgi:membrane-bound lytic murein transglycosylase D
MTGHARNLLIAFALLSSGACARGAAPVSIPEPVADSALVAAPAAMEQLGDDAGRKAPIEPAPKAVDTPATLESSGTIVTAADAVEPPAPLVRGEASWDIEVRDYLEHDRVEFYVKRFTGSARPTIVSWLQRGLKYEPMIRKVFRETGVAEDMYYLGLVESGYDPHAYSRAAAVGMWQFMTATARGVGLRVDWWVDERRDPMKSTKAAARFLHSLNEQFGSIYLAAAAYNGGPARVSRGLTRYADDVGDDEGDDQFFALAETQALRKETMNYVPQLIAAAAIGKEPWKYGINLDSVAPYAYDSILAPPATAYAALTFVTGAPLDSLRDHNPHLLRGVTPPNEPTWVRVPRGYATETAATDLLAIPDSVRAAWMTVKSRKGATVASMAKSFGITATQLRWYNPALRGNQIPAGTSVHVPTKLAISGAFSVADPSLEKYGAAVNGVHVVRKGETLSHIASRNNTSVSRLMALNGLKKNVIYPGQAIRVRAATSSKKR